MKVTKKMMCEIEAGNVGLFNQFYNQYSGYIFYYVSKCNLFGLDLVECVEEILINLIRCHYTFDYFKGDYMAWVYHICEKHTKIYIEDLKRRNCAFSSINYNFNVSDNGHIIIERKLSKIEEFVGEGNYAVLILKLGFKFNFKKIASILKLSVKDVKNRYKITNALVDNYKRERL